MYSSANIRVAEKESAIIPNPTAEIAVGTSETKKMWKIQQRPKQMKQKTSLRHTKKKHACETKRMNSENGKNKYRIGGKAIPKSKRDGNTDKSNPLQS